MADTKNVFISHVHEDDELVADLKQLIENAGMVLRNSSITSDKPNDAHNEEYIKQEYLKPGIEWAGTIVVLITHETAKSWWVDWEISYAVQLGKRVVGVFARGATDADIPEELGKCGDAAIVGWQGNRVVDAINGNIGEWDDPQSGKPRDPKWVISRYRC